MLSRIRNVFPCLETSHSAICEKQWDLGIPKPLWFELRTAHVLRSVLTRLLFVPYYIFLHNDISGAGLYLLRTPWPIS